MLLVKTYVAPSPIHGLGLFAAESIPKDTRIWEFHPAFDRFIAPEEFESLPPPAQAFLQVYAYPWPKGGDILLFSADNGRFSNHSDDANTVEREPYAYAARDIRAGEEITSDYRRLGIGLAGSPSRPPGGRP
ncbi:MAG TPA: SET domain-containing protein-lysine N-methyltransferase [Alphaproteobacteria bacterium]|nr:SET domain-containing protein-lysine N-methyltransferase [Alphaproteobacteria bacterium]